jgi:hypothetical protein
LGGEAGGNDIGGSCSYLPLLTVPINHSRKYCLGGDSPGFLIAEVR